MNLKFVEWISTQKWTDSEYFGVDDFALAIERFADEVNRRAEQRMLAGHKLEGSHHIAMKEILKEWGIEV